MVHGQGLGFGVRVRVRFSVRVKVFMESVSPLEVGVDVLALVAQIRPGDPSNIPSFAAKVTHAPQSVCAKDDAPANVVSILVTLDTSHLERSTLNDDAE